MKIKRLDILGFKSFHDRVSLDFQQGITGIVGPNGCGKSNVVDAIRWAMGEQSARNLRGKQMEDIIFGGSECRKPLGMAEVSLVFSTEDGRVPAKYLNYSDIQVTRRLYRDGESEYLLNKSQCRLLDIAELFMDTGVGARAYSIIEQGKIGMILHSKPEERRVLIEEAAGVTKFKARKQVALKKIDVTRQNLLRIRDILAEIKRQLSGLQRQAKKAEKFRELREELKEIDLLFFVNKYHALKDDKTLVDEELAELNKRVAYLVADQENEELAMEGKRITLVEQEEALARSQEEIYRVKGDIQGAENLREYQKKEMMNLDRMADRFNDDLANQTQQLTDAESELGSLLEHKDGFIAELADEEQSLLENEGLLEELTRAEMAVSGQVEEHRRELFAILSEIAQFNNKYSSTAKRLDAMAERLERNQRESLMLGEKHAEANERVADLESACKKIVVTKRATADEMTELKQREDELKVTLAAKEKELQVQREQLSAKSSRLSSIQELEAQFAGYGQGVRTLLQADGFMNRFRGMVADIVETDEAYEAAVEVVLGERLQWLLCDLDDDALDAVAYLKEVSGGRSSFVLQKLQAAQGPLVPGADELLEKVTVADGFKEFVAPLLAHTYLADTLDKALSLGKQHPQLAFVTAHGDMVHSGGIVTGGSLEAAQHGLIHKKREIKELSREVTVAAARVKELAETKAELGEEATAVEEGLRDVRQRLHQADIQSLNSEKDLIRAQEELQRIEERAAIRSMEDEQLNEEKLLLEKELSDTNYRKSAGEERKAAYESHLNELQQSLAVKKEEKESVRESVTARKVRVASLKEKRESNVQSIRRMEDLINSLRQKIAGHGAELEKSAEERERLISAINQSDESIGLLLQKLATAETAFTAVKERYELEAATYKEEETRLKGLRSLVIDAKEAITAKTIKSSELTLQLTHLENQLQEKYHLDIAVLLPKYWTYDFDTREKVARQGELHKLIEEMGDVNLTAIDEYQELDKRFVFLAGQKEDLEESLHSLQKAIQRINKTTRKRFLETFQLVNAKFQEVFPRLFCGGRAELKLTNEEDLLETGLEIIVQPPGKKLQNVTLLSGGEKALTAVALIFSIFLIKPTPFCLLDEVDAPLDDANIGRFNDMVREMSTISQFIIITHNKTTMAVVDTLYGVTMEEPGVSKLVSVKLN